jgi:hypothetical protein
MTDIRGQRSGSEAASGAEPTADRADLPTPVLAAGQDAVVRRTKDGWRVGGTDMPDLTSAMVLADLLSAELPGGATAAGPQERHGAGGGASRRDNEPAAGPAVTGAAAGAAAAEPSAAEAGRLRATIGQLEHALTARIRVEQAIGVLAERHRIQPRQAFEQLRTAARSRGRRVIDIATDVVASATNPLLQLPDELSRPRAAGRRARQAHGLVGSE